MSDGFSTPSPADTSDVDTTDDDAPLTERYDAIPDDPDADEELALVEQAASCEKCSHSGVCSIYNDFAAKMAQSFGPDTPGSDEMPVDPEKLAWHCEMYDPVEDEDGT